MDGRELSAEASPSAEGELAAVVHEAPVQEHSSEARASSVTQPAVAESDRVEADFEAPVQEHLSEARASAVVQPAVAEGERMEADFEAEEHGTEQECRKIH